MEINLISDTVTKPSQEMLRFMFNAEVGDDFFKQDPTTIQLEAKVAAMFGMEAGMFFPSGTMANQTAIKLHTQPGEELITDKWAHIYNYESGGIAFNSGVSCRLLDGNRGMITAAQVAEAINNPETFYTAKTSLVCVENTTNKGGGACYDIEELKKIKKVCDTNNLKYHLDGARLWNAIVARNEDPKTFGSLFDSISVCLSKGLGAPIGSVLISNKETIDKAYRVRKVLGGAMRQVGHLAAAGIFAIDNNINRLAEDHKRAKELGAVLQKMNWVEKVEPIETNILIFSLKEGLSDQLFVEKLKERNIHISTLGKGKLRIVTHLDYRAVMHSYVLETIERIVINY